MPSSFEGNIPSESFEEQFARRFTVDANGATVSFVDIAPPTLASAIPVLIAPGFGENQETFRPLQHALYNEGRRSIALSHPRLGGGNEHFEAALVAEHGIEELRKAHNLLAVLEARGVERADVMAMSEGAINASIAVMIAPERFRNLIFIGPAGLIGKDNYFALFSRFLGTIGKETVDLLKPRASFPEQRATTLAESWAYFLKNPVRGLQECGAIAKANIVEMLHTIHNNGVKTAVVIGVDDPVFDAATMNSVVSSASGIVDGFLSVKGGHYEIANDPQYGEAMAKLLASLEAKK